MDNRFLRTQMVIGEKGLSKLSKSKVVVFGIGGVGGYVCEALARSGIGNLIIIDNDTISLSNINRQIIATEQTIGREKTQVMKERMLSINPKINVVTHNVFFLPGVTGIIDEDADYIVDAIDTVSGKLWIAEEGERLNIPVISSMGTGNKLNPTELQVSDIYKTSVCPLAKVMRKELKDRGIKKLKVVYSKEQPQKSLIAEEELFALKEKTNKRQTPGSVSFVPPVAGFILASEVIKDLLKEEI